jgi:D-glycero-alpha-D-manno-heptose 1-phosphate guanylyltransferase
MEAIILAGGFGTRLRTAVANLPKSMASINGRPFLEFLLDRLSTAGLDHVILSVGYMRQVIMDHFKSSYKGLKISYAIEEEPLGTGGGVRLAMKQTNSEHVLVLNGDTLFMLDIGEFSDFHSNRKSSFSIALRHVESTNRYGSVSVNRDGIITGFAEKNSSDGPGLINAGIYLVSRKYFTSNPMPEIFSLEKDFIEKIYKAQHLYGFQASGYFIDIGIPDDFKKAQTEFSHLFPHS